MGDGMDGGGMDGGMAAMADPERVLVAESRPGGEGVGVAEELAEDGADVTLVTDAAVAYHLASGEVDAVLVGADTVLADGRVVNKVGTRGAALAAARADIPLYAVAARNKVAPLYAVAARNKVAPDAEPDLADADPNALYDGDAPLSVAAPLFDVTPADLVDGVITEDGVLDPADVAAVADEHQVLSSWRRDSPD